LDVSKHGERATAVGYIVEAYAASVHGGSAHGSMQHAANGTATAVNSGSPLTGAAAAPANGV
jgi:hypothetical protein